MTSDQTAQSVKVLNQLMIRWWIAAGISVLTLTGGFVLLRFVWEEGSSKTLSFLAGLPFPFHWTVLCTAGLAYLLIVFRRHLSENYRAGEHQALPDLGPGNLLTLIRGGLIAILGGFLFAPRPEGWLALAPSILFTLAVFFDFLDGYAARVSRHATRLGEILDLSFDGWGVLVGAWLAVQYEQVPAWYISIALARWIFTTAIWLRHRLGLPVFELPYLNSRRVLAGLQMGFIAVILWPVFSPPGTHIAALAFSLPFLAGFVRDWLIVIGRVRQKPDSLPDKPFYWGTLLLRILVAALVSLSITQRFTKLEIMAASGAVQQTYYDEIILLTILEGLVLLFILLGISGRLASIAGLFLLGLHQVYTGLSFIQVLLIVGYTAVLFAGTGRLSLWRPEEWLIDHRAGERPEPAAAENGL